MRSAISSPDIINSKDPAQQRNQTSQGEESHNHSKEDWISNMGPFGNHDVEKDYTEQSMVPQLPKKQTLFNLVMVMIHRSVPL
eukprot:1007261-Amphidinium_carterae.1